MNNLFKIIKSLRKRLIIFLFEHSQRIYTSLFKSQESWNVTKADLLKLPQPSFGRHLGEFLHKNDFELIPKVERHDCYHVLCGYSTEVEDEIALQCLCYGNGKRSPYLYGAIILGVAILPDYYQYYYKSYTIGKLANPFHHFNYKNILDISIKDFRAMIFSKSELKQLQLNYEL